MFLRSWLSKSVPLAFPCVLFVYWLHFSCLCACLGFWLLNKHSFRISLRLCMFIGRALAGCICFCSSGCSISTPLALPCACACLLAALQLVYWPPFSWLCLFCSSGCSLSTPLAFPCVLLVYWPSFSWLSMFLLFLLLTKHSLSVSLRFACLLASL